MKIVVTAATNMFTVTIVRKKTLSIPNAHAIRDPGLPGSSFLVQNSSFKIQNSSFLIHDLSFLMQNSYQIHIKFIITPATGCAILA